MRRSIQKVVLNGNSAQVTIVRWMLPELGLRPGDPIECWVEDGVFHLRSWKNRETAPGQHPVTIDTDSPLVLR